MKIGIAADSHCGMSAEQAQKLGVRVLPMPLYMDGVCRYEGETLTREEFFAALKTCETVGTSQASIGEVADMWRKCLEECDALLYMPISRGLSGACNTAKILSEDEEFAGRVFVVDNGRISTPMHRAILDARELIEKGFGTEEIRDILEAEKDKMSIYIAVETLEYLKKGGRISGTAATIGTLLDIKPILRLNTGLLEQHEKCRGMKKAKRTMIDAIKADIAGRFAGRAEEDIHLLVATSADEAATQEWIAQVQESFPGKEILCAPLSLGICCHTGAGALGIGISCRPRTGKE